jgi:hypothetical protein
MGAEDDVVWSQAGADANGYRLLTDVGVAGARDVPLLVRASELLLSAPDEHHLPVERQ